MKKVFKFIGILLGIVIVAVIAAVIIVPLVFDPNDHKEEIAAFVKKQTGRELTIGDDIELSVFPWIGVSFGKLELGNAAGFGPEPFARIDAADVRIKLLPLLQKEVEVATIQLKGVRLNLTKNTQGQGNWEDLLGAAPADQEAATPSADAPSGAPLAALAIGGIEIVDTQLTWTDQGTDTRQTIENLNLKTGAISLGEPVDARLSFDLSSNQPPARAHVELATTLLADLSQQRHRLSGTRLDIDFDVNEHANTGSVHITTDADFDMGANTLQLIPLKIESQLTDKVSGIKADSNIDTQLRFDLDAQKLALVPTRLTVKATGEGLPPEGAVLEMSSDINIDLQQQTLHVTKLLLQFLGANLSGDIKGRQIIDQPNFKGSLALAPLNPRELIAKLDQPIPEMSDANAFTQADLALEFEAGLDQLKVNKLLVHLDQSTLTSNATIKNFAQPAVAFNVDLDAIDLDRYLPPTSEKEQQAATPASAAAAGATEVPMETLRSLDINGKLKVGQLKVSNLRVAAVNAVLKAKNGLITLHPLTAQLYEGNYSGNMQIDARGEVLKIALDEQLQGIAAGPLLKDMLGDDKLQGTGNAQINVAALGTTPDEIMKTLTGKTAILFKDGAIKGINIGSIIRRAKARLAGEATAAPEVEATDFAELSATVTFDKGVARNSDLAMKSPLLRVTGKGSVDLVKQSLDYVATTTIVETSKGQGGKELEELKGLPLDIKISGTFAEPKFGLDLGAAMKEKAKEKAKKQLDEKKEELKEKLQEKLQDKLPGGLKSFF